MKMFGIDLSTHALEVFLYFLLLKSELRTERIFMCSLGRNSVTGVKISDEANVGPLSARMSPYVL